MQVTLTQSATRFSPGGHVTINGRLCADLRWLGAGLSGVALYPEGEKPIIFKDDAAFRRWVRDWHKRNI